MGATQAAELGMGKAAVPRLHFFLLFSLRLISSDLNAKNFKYFLIPLLSKELFQDYQKCKQLQGLNKTLLLSIPQPSVFSGSGGGISLNFPLFVLSKIMSSFLRMTELNC